MAGELEKAVRDSLRRLDEKDFASLPQFFTDDAQSVDELSRSWIRGRQSLVEYFRKFGPALDNIRSEVRDAREVIWGEVGLVTFWLEQDYDYQGKPTHSSAPTTVLLRRTGPDWKIALFHSIPLPEAAS